MMSLMTKLSPQRIQGLMMGMWFLASAYGQYVAGLLGAGMASVDPDRSNLDRLIDTRRRFDPDDVFRFRQAIPLRRPRG